MLLFVALAEFVAFAGVAASADFVSLGATFTVAPLTVRFAIISLLSLILILVCAFSKPKYKEQELLCWCELLPITEGIYAIKTNKKGTLLSFLFSKTPIKSGVKYVKI